MLNYFPFMDTKISQTNSVSDSAIVPNNTKIGQYLLPMILIALKKSNKMCLLYGNIEHLMQQEFFGFI